MRNVHVRDCTVARILMHAVGYNDDGIGAVVPPKFSDCTFKNVCILGKSLTKPGVMVDVPAVELEGFDVPGFEVEDVEFRHCTVARTAEIKMQRCEKICFDLKQIR